MDRDALGTWIADRPEIAEQLLRVLARRLRRTNNNLADLIFTDVPGRVAKLLLQLAQRFGIQDDGALRVTHELTQEEIAQLVGASRETVTRRSPSSSTAAGSASTPRRCGSAILTASPAGRNSRRAAPTVPGPVGAARE